MSFRPQIWKIFNWNTLVVLYLMRGFQKYITHGHWSQFHCWGYWRPKTFWGQSQHDAPFWKCQTKCSSAVKSEFEKSQKLASQNHFGLILRLKEAKFKKGFLRLLLPFLGDMFSWEKKFGICTHVRVLDPRSTTPLEADFSKMEAASAKILLLH